MATPGETAIIYRAVENLCHNHPSVQVYTGAGAVTIQDGRQNGTWQYNFRDAPYRLSWELRQQIAATGQNGWEHVWLGPQQHFKTHYEPDTTKRRVRWMGLFSRTITEPSQKVVSELTRVTCTDLDGQVQPASTFVYNTGDGGLKLPIYSVVSTLPTPVAEDLYGLALEKPAALRQAALAVGEFVLSGTDTVDGASILSFNREKYRALPDDHLMCISDRADAHNDQRIGTLVTVGPAIAI